MRLRPKFFLVLHLRSLSRNSPCVLTQASQGPGRDTTLQRGLPWALEMAAEDIHAYVIPLINLMLVYLNVLMSFKQTMVSRS